MKVSPERRKFLVVAGTVVSNALVLAAVGVAAPVIVGVSAFNGLIAFGFLHIESE
jgi:hypothetical protein